jgi:serine/threonine-protein phosphatase 4 regulatory subunit 1
VRLTVASSIHELAVILGEDLATRDLVPVFNGFIKDVDEVRIGALKHLAEFLKVSYPPSWFYVGQFT